MIRTGELLQVRYGTKVLVIDLGTVLGFLPDSYNVRILEGPYLGRTGWLSYEHVRK